MEGDKALRAFIYRHIRDEGAAPSVRQCAEFRSSKIPDIEAALDRLAASRTLVLRPESHEIWMAHPYSGVPTDYRVSVGDRSWFANCAWDALAILSLYGEGSFEAPDPNTGDPVHWQVRGGEIEPDGVVHFAVPARDFWDDIGFT